MNEPGYPPRSPGYPGRSGRSRAPEEHSRNGWQALGAFEYGDDRESDLPPWAVPRGVDPIRPARGQQRLADPPLDDRGPSRRIDRDERSGARHMADSGRPDGRSRAAAGRRRRSKRRLVTWGGTAIVVVLLVLGGWYFASGSAPGPKSKYITALQKGELRQVPDSCNAVGTAVVRRVLQGTPSTQPYAFSAKQSGCTFTVDAKPVFRELNIAAQEYPPSLTTPGNGSATTAATYSFAQQRKQFIKPPKNTPQPPATVSPVAGLGNAAVTAVQVYHAGGAVDDRVTVLARYRNVIVTVSLQGRAGGGFGPVSVSQLRAAAIEIAREAMAKVQSEPKIS